MVWCVPNQTGQDAGEKFGNVPGHQIDAASELKKHFGCEAERRPTRLEV